MQFLATNDEDGLISELKDHHLSESWVRDSSLKKLLRKLFQRTLRKKFHLLFFTVSWEFEVVNVDCISNFYTFYCCWKYCFLQVFQPQFEVSEYPFKQNRSMLKNRTMLLHTYFVNISLNVLRPTFFNICNLPFFCSPNIGKIRVNVGPKTNYFTYFMSSCPNRIAFFNIFLHWYVTNQETNKTVPAIFFILNIFWMISFWLFSWKIRFQKSPTYCYKKWTTDY